MVQMDPEHGRSVVCIGELLWDLLPTGPQLGGAPANVAVLAGALGDRAALVSRIGRDALGQQAQETLQQRPVLLDHLSIDPEHATGSVSVHLDGAGVATYTIREDVAWDHLLMQPALQDLARSADAVCFGTLAQRSAPTRATLRAFVRQTTPACVRVFDVNLRPPYASAEVVLWGLEHATILKMNHEEVHWIAECVGAPALGGDAKLLARSLLAQFPIEVVAVTRGSQGCLLVTRRQSAEHPGTAVQVADTIGAGDAFTAALTHFYLRQAPLSVLAEAGARWGAWVATQTGGMPLVPKVVRDRIHAEITESLK